ncbi:unnamed protein product [Ambrosiozyma monospora]|uniref:Unnamed protein product n=1 Tax=Ambrosiozyma monospora TaxID=43982 RepID=A0A9W6YQU4_AMBMO|nr:unnamed protein product [Ambrosiozyma monospora]
MQTAKIPDENPFKTNKFYIDQVSIIDQPLSKNTSMLQQSPKSSNATIEEPLIMPSLSVQTLCYAVSVNGKGIIKFKLQKQIHPTFSRRE